jgi:hypothetical protein
MQGGNENNYFQCMDPMFCTMVYLWHFAVFIAPTFQEKGNRYIGIHKSLCVSF